MAIIFVKREKRQRTLIIVFVLVIIITIIVLWQGFFKKEIPAFPEEAFLPPPKEVKINFEIFEHPKIKELLPFTEIEPFTGEEIGRENPFMPY